MAKKIVIIEVDTNDDCAALEQRICNAVAISQDADSDGDGTAPRVCVFKMLGPLNLPESVYVHKFHEKFDVPMSPVPAFLDHNTLMFRIKFMAEELQEFCAVHGLNFHFELKYFAVPARYDLREAADALVDLVYVAHGTALMMGLPWRLLWDEVQRANMSKERAKSAAESKRGSVLDVVKPEGWEPPDHTVAVGAGPWPTFFATSRILKMPL